MPDSDKPAPKGALAGGHAASHAPVEDLPLLVGPSTEAQLNTLRFTLIPVACWRINDVRFDFDSAFVLPEAKDEFAELGTLRVIHKGAPASIFGHADPVGSDDYNKALSGRRAEAIYAVLIRDPDRWEKIRGQEPGQWGLKSVQIMLQALGEDPGEPTGNTSQQTHDAVVSFQSKNDLKPDGDPGPKTRKKLFAAYMDFLAPGVTLGKTDFLAQGADPGGKGDFQGCSEFNPALIFSADEDARFQKPENKKDRDQENSPNRRVLLLLFRPGTVVPADKWPCPRAGEGVEKCKKRFWSDGETRRSVQTDRREFAKTADTFACRFYHRLVVSSPCEGTGPITPQTQYLKLTSVDDHFAPNQESLDITYVLMGFGGRSVKLEIYSPLYQGGAPLFSRELTEDEKTDGEHTIQWDGKANTGGGDLQDRFIHPLFSPYKVHLFHDVVYTGELETKVLYHSIVLKQGPWTPDEAEPAKGSKDWVQFKLNKLGYIGGPVAKDTEDYLKRAVIRYKVNHKKFHQPLIGSYDDSITPDLVTALDAGDNDRKFPDPEAVADSSKKSDLFVEELTYEQISNKKDEFGSTRPPHEVARLNRPLVPVEAEIWIKKKDDSKVFEPEAVGPCRINWTHKDADEDLSSQFGDTPSEPSKTKKFIETVLQQEQGRTGSNGDNCPIKFGGIRDTPDNNWKTPFFAGDFYIPYTVQQDTGNKVVFSTANVDKAKFAKRLGRAGILLRPSYIAGDDHQFHAEISFQGLPNQKDLETFHGITADPKTHLTADTGVFTIRRFARVVTSIDWPARTNDYEWSKIRTEFQKSFLDVDVDNIETKKMSGVLTLKQYQDLVVANTKHKDPSKISLFDDAMVGVDLPSQGNDDADTYKQTLKAFTHSNYNSKIQTPLGRLLSSVIRKDHPTGFIICNFLLHKPVDIKNNPGKKDTKVTNGNKRFITWGGSIGLPDSVILLDQRDPDHVYYVVSHEMGHNLYLLHWENTGENNTANHDQNDHNCTMSYSDFSFASKGHFAHQAPGVYSPHFCGKCNLSIRGWDVTQPGMKSKSKEKGGPDEVPVVTVTPAITISSSNQLVPVKRDTNAVKRQPVTLQIDNDFDGSVVLNRSSNAMQFFDAESGGKEIVFDGSNNAKLDPKTLKAGQKIFAQGALGQKVTLTLKLSGGTKKTGADATAVLFGVEVILDICQRRISPSADPAKIDTAKKITPGGSTSYRLGTPSATCIIVQQPKFTDYKGPLTLTLEPLDDKVQIFPVENPAKDDKPLAMPYELDGTKIDSAGTKLWILGNKVSGDIADTGVRLGIKELNEKECDKVGITVGPAIAAENATDPAPTVMPVKNLVTEAAATNVLKLSVAPSGTTGTFAWSSSSSLFKLTNDTTVTVTLTSDKTAGSSPQSEEIKLTYTPSGKSAFPAVTHKLGVADVIFSKEATHPWGYDPYEEISCRDNTGNTSKPKPDPKHDIISVKKSSTGKVKVEIKGAQPTDVFFKSKSDSIAKPKVKQPGSASEVLEVDGGAIDKNDTVLEARLVSETGPVVAELGIVVLKQVVYQAEFFRVKDSTSTKSKLNASPKAADLQTECNKYYLPGVSDWQISGGATELDIAYDKNKNGIVDMEPGATPEEEKKIIDTCTSSKTRVIYVHDLRWNYYLAADSKSTDTKITVKNYGTTYLGYISSTGTYSIEDNKGNTASVTITAVNTATGELTLSAAIGQAFKMSDKAALIWPLGGRGGNPLWVSDVGDIANYVSHELGHTMAGLLDLCELDNIMYGGPTTGSKLRQRPIPKYYTPASSEEQWKLMKGR